MGYAASERYGRAAGAAIVMGSIAPDLDNVLMLAGDTTYLEYHRVISNSLPGMFVLSLACAFAAGMIWKDGGLRGPGGKRGLWKLWALAFASVSVHIIFDLLNSYGMKPFWPVSDGWHALDAVFIVDPFMTVPIILAIVLMKMGRNRMRVLAALAVFITVYAGGRVALHHEAVSHIREANPGAVRVGAFPSPLNPLEWRAVIDNGDGYETGWYDLYGGGLGGVERLTKPADTPVIEAAKGARAVKVFLGFARFPLASVRKLQDGWEVSFTDLRFGMRKGEKRFVASVKVNEDMTHGPGTFSFGSE